MFPLLFQVERPNKQASKRESKQAYLLEVLFPSHVYFANAYYAGQASLTVLRKEAFYMV